MELKYWADKALEEKTLPKEDSGTAVSNFPEPDNIVSFDEARKIKEEEQAREDKEIDDFFAAEEQISSRKSIAKYIFVDGLLGIPLLTVCDLIISALVALFFVLSVALVLSCIGLFIGGLIALGLGFTIVAERVPTGLAMIAASVLALAASFILLMLAYVFGLKLMPWIAKLAGKLENKLHLFRTK